MNELTFDERNLACIYNSAGNRCGLIASLREMCGYLEPDEMDLCELTDSAIAKLEAMSDADYEALDLIPDFGPEDFADGE